MRLCTKCVLPESFPSVTFDGEGVCNYCREFKGRETLDAAKGKYRTRFEELLEKHHRPGVYDCLMAYSGGKDSTFTLTVLREKYDLSILALTIDNGFVSPTAVSNIKKVAEGLGIDHIFYKPRFDLVKLIFRKAVDSEMYSRKSLERASTICTSCMGLVKFIALRLAIEGGIPFIMYGWSPGQAPIEASIFKNNALMIRSMQKVLFDPMREAAGTGIQNYFLTDAHFAMADRFPYNISPLAFLEYDESEIFAKIKALGWEKPADTDPNSTNCLLNTFANMVHKQRYAYNPYAFELAKLVREGYLDRDEAIKRLDEVENKEILDAVRKRLGIV